MISSSVELPRGQSTRGGGIYKRSTPTRLAAACLVASLALTVGVVAGSRRALAVAPGGDPAPREGPVSLGEMRSTGVVKGSAALHEHVMAEWAFSGRWFWGSVEGEEQDALATCDGNGGAGGPTHGGASPICEVESLPINVIGRPLGPDTCCHTGLRRGYCGQEAIRGWTPASQGKALYSSWPDWDTQAHPRYWQGHLKMAHDAGMTLMVVVAVENEALCELTTRYVTQPQPGPASGRSLPCSHGDSFESLKNQIVKLKAFVQRNGDFLEIAYSPADARRIINDDNKMAIVIGIEADYAWGNLRSPIDELARLQQYYDLGVRTAFLAHQINTPLAGAAQYLKELWGQQSFSNCFYLNVQCGSGPREARSPGHAFQVWQGDTINSLGCKPKKRLDSSLKDSLTQHPPRYASSYAELCPVPLARRAKFARHWDGFTAYPGGGIYTDVEQNYEQRSKNIRGVRVRKNALGLTPEGEKVVREMMKKGMLLEVGHISERAIQRIVVMSHETYNYPLFSGHTLVRATLPAKSRSIDGKAGAEAGWEYALGDQTLDAIRQSEGVAGLFAAPDPTVDYPLSSVENNCVRSTRSLAQPMAYVIDRGVNVAWAGDWMGQGLGVAPRLGFSKRFKDWCGGNKAQQNAQNPKQSADLTLAATPYERNIAYLGTRGLGHWGLLDALNKDLADIGTRETVLRKFRDEAAENVLRTWEKAEYIAHKRWARDE